MGRAAKLNSKGQVAIPQEIRIRMGLKARDRVEFVIENGQTILRPARGRKSRFEDYIGVLPRFKGGIKGINAWVREMRGDDADRD
ncbi:MAG: AbrB/MazE/SpoVT family DNA-binding domain-containing protein [Silvibacterium sp.]|nr:AbrB/MazE/SpoVT family DNA-binding domain-containing protein [Silvibacterium sp.]